MNLSFFLKRKKLKTHEFDFFLQAKKTQKTWIYFFYNPNQLKKHYFNFLQTKKTQKNTILIFSKVKKLTNMNLIFGLLQIMKNMTFHACLILQKWKQEFWPIFVYVKLKNRYFGTFPLFCKPWKRSILKLFSPFKKQKTFISTRFQF